MQVRPVSDETFDAVKAGLPPDVAAKCDDDCIRRFIRASGGNSATVRVRTSRQAAHTTPTLRTGHQAPCYNHYVAGCRPAPVGCV